MRRNLNIVFLGTGVLLIAGLLYAQVGTKSPDDLSSWRSAETKKMIELVRELYAELGTPDGKLTCRLDYTIASVTRGPGDSLIGSTSDVSYLGTQESIAVVSEEMSLFQDAAVGVTIVPSEREIQIFPSTPDDLRNSRRKAMQAFQEELFVRSAIRECNATEEPNTWRLVLEPEQTFTDWYHIRRVEITFSPEGRRIHSIHSEFDDKVRYASMTLTYNRLECTHEDDGKESPVDFSALGKVYASGGVLKPEYRGFEVIDHRTINTP